MNLTLSQSIVLLAVVFYAACFLGGYLLFNADFYKTRNTNTKETK